MSKSNKLKQRYYEEFGSVDISSDFVENHLITYINTSNYYAYSLYSEKSTFDEYEEDIRTLYKVVFNNSKLMKTYYYDGQPLTIASFENLVNINSLCCKLSIPFIGYIIKNNEDDKVVGYEVIKYAFDNMGQPIPNSGRICYVIADEYQGKKAASENVGALVLYYGEELFFHEKIINQYFDSNKNQPVTGTTFQKLTTNVFESNVPSQKILTKYGFIKTASHYDPNHETYDTYEKDYMKDGVDLGGDICYGDIL